MAELAIRLEDNNRRDKQSKGTAPSGTEEDVRIIWKGKKIAKVVFASGKEVTFEE